jgi:hypothetical protein
MSKTFKIPLALLLMTLIISVSSYTNAEFNFSDVKEVSDNKLSRGGSVTSAGEGEGAGFYLTIYEDIVKNPNKRVESAIKKRFGVDFKVDLSPAQQSGKLLFTDFFKDPITSSYKGTSTPELKSSLITDCVRIKAAQAEDEKRRWDLVRKRLGERNQAMEDGNIEEPQADPAAESAAQAEIINRELLNRLIGLVDEESDRRLQAAIADIPDATTLNEQDTLLRCYSDFSREVDFELRLQTILHPTRRQMEVLSTFMNDRLDDFTDQNSLYGSSFPRYDLLFDIDVIDYIIFGSPVTVTAGVSGDSGVPVKEGGFSDYNQVIEFSTSPGRPDSGGSAGSGGDDPSLTGGSGGDSSSSPGSDEDGFGSSTGSFAGPFCADDLDGLDLDESLLDPDQQSESADADRDRDVDDKVEDLPPLRPIADADDPEGEDGPPREGDSDTGEGSFQIGPNLTVACEGTAGVDFGNEFLKLLFCINIGFEKKGKSWSTMRDEDCIACHMYRMNEVFEEYVLKTSVRPHKNTGTIMESAVCEDGYGDDIGFHFFLEWVPVKLFPDICYPQGGDGNDDGARAEYADMVGYPEVLHRTDRKTMYVECEADFNDESDQKRCEEALNGQTQLSYEQFRASYLADISRAYQEDPESKLQDIDQIKKDGSVWARLVGNHGIAERELHVFLYRLGQVPAQYEEDEQIEQDFKKRQDDLEKEMKKIEDNTTLSDIQKTEQYLCIKGFALAAQKGRSVNLNCDAEDTLVALEDDIISERNRVMRITQRWNQESRDFGKENKCGTFSGSGIYDAFWENTLSAKTDSGYFFETDYRRTQTPEQQITGQLATNADLNDFDRLFSAINQEVEFIAEAQVRQEQQERFQTDQDKGLQLFTALAAEMASFRSNMQALTNWWSEMVDDKQFVNKGGERINVLESYLEKLN